MADNANTTDAAAAGPFVYTPEQLAALPHDNQAPRLIITIWFLIALATSFLAMRLYCKLSRHSGLWWDDYILIGSWVCITIESALLTYATTLGYGKHLWDLDLTDYPSGVKQLIAINAGGSLSITAAIWSKTSFAITLLKLTHGWLKSSIWVIIITMNIAMGASALFNWIHCTPVRKTWDPIIDGTCWDYSIVVNYNIFSAAYSAAMDITLALIPWKLIMGLQMKKKEKIGAALAMSMGVFAGITAIVKTSKIKVMLSTDPADGVDLFIWGNAESCVTIVAASIPVLRVLIRDVATTAARRYYASSGSQGGTKALKSQNTHVAASSARRSRIDNLARKEDDSSDRSILDGQTGVGVAVCDNTLPIHHPSGQIMRTDEVAVEYHERKGGYEMQNMGRMA